MNDNLFDLYFKYTSDTEPTILLHRWSLIACVGAWLGRNFWLPFGSWRIFPNQYVMFVGDPGSRKSTAVKLATSILSEAGYDTFAAQKTSKEKFLLDLTGEDDEPAFGNRRSAAAEDVLAALKLDDGEGGTNPAEVFITADEFNNFLGNGNIEFLSLLGELWDWDSPTRGYKQRLKNSRSISIYQPTISILAGNTPAGFALAFPPATIGQGFMSRLILVHGEESGRKIAWPTTPDEKIKQALVEHFKKMRIACNGAATVQQKAKDALDTIYRSWDELEDQRFKHYSTRRFTHLLKLTLIFAATRLSREIGIQDVLHANTVLAYAETLMPKAIGELGKSKQSEAANKLMNFLYAAREPKTVQDCWKVVQQDLEKITDLTTLLGNLQVADKIQVTRTANGKQGYLPVQKVVSRKLLYVDFNYLKGKELPE